MFVMGMEAWKLIPLCMNEQSDISSKQVESLLDAVDELTFEWAERRPPNLIKTHAISPALEMARMVVKSATQIYPDLEQTPAFWTIKTNLGMLQKMMHVYRGTWSGLHVCIEPAKVTQRYTQPVKLLTGPNAAKLITGTPETKTVKVNSLLMPDSATYSGASDDSSPQRNKAQQYLMGDISSKTPNQAYMRSPSWRPTSAPSRVERTPISTSSMLAFKGFTHEAGQRRQQQSSPGSPLGKKPTSGSQVVTQSWLSSPTSARLSLENKLRRETESRGPTSPSQGNIYNPHLGKRISPQSTSSPHLGPLPQNQSPYSPQKLYLNSSSSNLM